MKRKISKQLIVWQENSNRPLLITGARQIGKTYIIQKFAKDNFENTIFIDFERDLRIREIFNIDLNITTLITNLSFYYPNITKPNTIIFFDEIQACPNALTALKFFALEKSYHIIASGSLVGIMVNDISYPTGYIDTIRMHQFDFEEFLWALDYSDEQIAIIKQHYYKSNIINESIHQQLNDLFKLYLIIGGMPACLNEYIVSNDLHLVSKLKKQLLNDYYMDIGKYANTSLQPKIKAAYDSIPIHLSRNNKKFIFKEINSNARARDYEEGLKWLEDIGLTIKVNRLKTIDIPLNAYFEMSSYKLFYFDTGLLISMYDDSIIESILNNDLMIYKGAIYENIIAMILNIKNIRSYYYEFNTSEIDFIIQNKNKILPIEVKSSTNTRSKSLSSYLKKHPTKKAFKLSMNNLNMNDDVTKSLPLYLFALLNIEEY